MIVNLDKHITSLEARAIAYVKRPDPIERFINKLNDHEYEDLITGFAGLLDGTPPTEGEEFVLAKWDRWAAKQQFPDEEILASDVDQARAWYCSERARIQERRRGH